MSAPRVAIEGLHRSFTSDPLRRRLLRRKPAPPLQVLRGVELTLEAGEWLGVLGGNGAGKTTLLKIIGGLLLPSAGSVRVDGLDVRSEPSAVRDAVGYVLADERSFQWRLTARQNLRFFASLERLGGREAGARIDELLTRLDLAGDADRPFYELSTGMRQRLAMARSLLKRPRVLLMDEPTRSIDATHAAEVWPLVRAELEAVDGCAILVTHYRQDAEAQCSRIAWLEDGLLHEQPGAEQSPLAGTELFTITVQRLAQPVVETLRRLPGVEELELSPGRNGDQLIELASASERFSLAGFIEVLTSEGASVVALETKQASSEPRLRAIARGATR